MEIVTVTDNELGVIISKEEALMILSLTGSIVWGNNPAPERTIFRVLYQELRDEGSEEGVPAYEIYEWFHRDSGNNFTIPLNGITFTRKNKHESD